MQLGEKEPRHAPAVRLASTFPWRPFDRKWRNRQCASRQRRQELRAVLCGCDKRLRESNGPADVSFDCRRNNGRPRFPSCRPSRLESVAAIAGGGGEGRGRGGGRRDTPPDGGEDQEGGSALETDRLAVGAILDVTGRPQTRSGFRFFTIPQISVLEYKRSGGCFCGAAALPTQALHRRTFRSACNSRRR